MSLQNNTAAFRWQQTPFSDEQTHNKICLFFPAQVSDLCEAIYELNMKREMWLCGLILQQNMQKKKEKEKKYKKHQIYKIHHMGMFVFLIKLFNTSGSGCCGVLF